MELEAGESFSGHVAAVIRFVRVGGKEVGFESETRSSSERMRSSG